MEVTSSTTASTSQDDSPHMLPSTAEVATTADSAVVGSVVSTSSAEGDGLNNTVSTDVNAGTLETVPVRYGPVAPPPSFYTSEPAYSKDVRDSKAVHGSCGLYNLGNTCFMNAGLQSLMSCSPLVKYFCENYVLTEANKHMLVAQFYLLLCKIWSGQFAVVHPRKFKECLGFYHSQFEDFRQHDCQEFLALLLDTLHEQLNNATMTYKHSHSSSSLPVTSTSSSALPHCCKESQHPTAVVSTSCAVCPPFPVGDSHAQVDDAYVDGSDGSDLNNKEAFLPAAASADSKAVEVSCSPKSPDFLSATRPSVGTEDGRSPSYPSEGSPNSEASALDSVTRSPSCHSDGAARKFPDEGEDDELIPVSFPALRRYTSHSNLDDVSSSDSVVGAKPSLKRVSSRSSVSASCSVAHSEDSNHSSMSAHSTDSEQSSAFKRLKIDSTELNRSANNNAKDCVTSSSDYKKINKARQNFTGDGCVQKELGDGLVTSNVTLPSPQKDLNVIDNMVSSCQDVQCVDIKNPSLDKSEVEPELSPGLPYINDFYSKETKTLNTNVIVSDFLQEITSDSEKFAKVDNRNRPPSKEINILQEAFGEEDKAEKVLIGQRFGGVKETNLYAQTAVAVVKPVKKPDPNMLNNSLDMEAAMLAGAMSKFAPSGSGTVAGETQVENNLPLKLAGEACKLDEEEKNVQMQAYTKFNTVPIHSNIRTDLTDTTPGPDSMEVDEAEVESSDEEEIQVALHTCAVEECSSVPNCMRHCLPSEVVMANRAWDEYQAKNDSVVVSTFQGQFRSTVVCSECSHVSVTYEPFMYLSLPIPHAMDLQMCVVYISQHKPPARYLLNLLKTDKIGTAKKKLCELIGEEVGDVIMAEVLDSHISRILDDNILLKYVNTFNRKIYAFEIISMDSAQGADSLSCSQMLNNEENPSSLQHDFELASSSRAELTCLADSQGSNQSFDSVNVHSPSSRDTLEYMFSDSEVCEPSSQDQESKFGSTYFGEADNGGECHSSSDGPRSEPWICGGYPGGHPLGWNVNEDEFDDDGNASVITNDTAVASSSSPDRKDDQIISVTSGFSADKYDREEREDVEDNKSPFSVDRTADDDDVNEAAAVGDDEDVRSSSHLQKPALHFGHSLDRHEEGDTAHGIASSQSDKAWSKCSTVTTTSSPTSTISINNNNSSGFLQQLRSNNSSGGGSRNTSHSCPSPETTESFALAHQEHESTLLDVAARLESSPGSYFLHRSQPDDDYGYCPEDDGTRDVADLDSTFDGGQLKSRCEKTDWTCAPGLESSTSDTQEPPAGPVSTDQWRSCAICLEDLLDTELLTHIMCDGVFCQNCLEMSVKHTADVSAFSCPICLQPASICHDFVPLATASATKPKIRTLAMSIAFRQNVHDNTGSSILQLFGHPNILHMPSLLSGDTLYSLVGQLVSPLLLTYTIVLTDGQGLTCSRCAYSHHCTGCEIAREGEITLQPSDCLTVHILDTLSPDQVTDLHVIHDDPSMAGLRSSEPTTIMDCFGAFTQSEILDEHNPWYCPQCERNQCAKKTMTVWRYPDNLIIHLKRFVYQDLSSTKVDTKVIYPHEGMDVRGFLSGPSSSGLVYDLYSIVCHFGGASAGHYTCFAKHPITSQWYYYNDETVNLQAPSDSEYSSGYVLFYQRRGTDVVFSPPQNLPFLEDDRPEASVPTSSSAHSMNKPGSSSSHNNSHSTGNNDSMALVLFQPPAASTSQLYSSKADDEDDDDYDNERRCSPSDDKSLDVHFWPTFPDQHPGTQGEYGEDDDYDGDGRTHMAEPDSTLEFYS